MNILGIGNAIVDVICKVENEFLTKNNLTKSNMKLIDEKEFKNLLINLEIEEEEPIVNDFNPAIMVKLSIRAFAWIKTGALQRLGSNRRTAASIDGTLGHWSCGI